MSKIFEAEAPSNIALIKYMGKNEDQGKNHPSNPSLSLTLNHLLTRVEIEVSEREEDCWEPLAKDGWHPIDLSAEGQERFLSHLGMLKSHFGLGESFLVRSANNFPSDCGLASSASSFAALTMAFKEYLLSVQVSEDLSDQEWAMLSRKGSGSSCRSFLGPVVIWDGDRVFSTEIPYGNLIHQVVVVDAKKKKVSSSEAHRRVRSSSLFEGRNERSAMRMEDLLDAFHSENWSRAFEIVWAEFWDMHALFETSHPPFGYMKANTLKVLNDIQEYWEEHGDGPLVTMDAGANVHLIYRKNQKELSEAWKDRWKDLEA